MEKFSAYRDPGTGIQPFLKPVPPLGSELLAKVTIPLRYALATVRTILILGLVVVYLSLVQGICLFFLPIPPLYRIVEHALTMVVGYPLLFVLGSWISVEQVHRKRGKVARSGESWSPKAGDIVVSNWVSWIELIWLAIRFNPTFVLPIPESTVAPSESKPAPVMHTPGRRTGTGSANIQPPSHKTSTQIPIIGFQQISLLSIVRMAGYVPPFGPRTDLRPKTLDELRKNASRPIVVFPECTTSNGRGLLRFADVFHRTVPIKNFQVFLMCVRYDPPTALAPSPAHSIPTDILNPLPHLFSLTTSLSTLPISIRLLAPSESPGSQLFAASEILSDYSGEDQLSEACSTLIAQIGKLKRTGMGWEDKANFLEFYKGKSR